MRRWKNGRRIRFLHGIPRPDYLALINASDAVLDPFPISHVDGAVAAMALVHTLMVCTIAMAVVLALALL